MQLATTVIMARFATGIRSPCASRCRQAYLPLRDASGLRIFAAV